MGVGHAAVLSKTLHATAGKHIGFPLFEVDSSVRFLERHLGGAVTAPAA
ncbi:hypothetical protein [Streptomyces sp. NPDC026673]